MASFIFQTIFMLLVALFVMGFVVGTVAALRRWRGGWRLMALLPLLGVITVVVTIVVDVSADPTAHNLWPFEVLGAVGVASAGLGSLSRASGSGRCSGSSATVWRITQMTAKAYWLAGSAHATWS